MSNATVDGDAIRRLVLDQSFRAGVGHIGPALSIADIVAVLVGRVAPTIGSDENERDRLVLSKGHAALALYCALNLQGVISSEELSSYCADGSRFGVHPEHQTPGVDFSTGSLGQGLGLAAGFAWSARMRGTNERVFVILSDAELNEGSSWEAVMFVAHHGLGNLTALIDLNGQQALGKTRDVLDIGDVGAKFASFGWQALSVNGHDSEALERAVRSGDGSRPLVVVANTVSGHGVSFMERKIEWHYLPLSADQYAQALREIDP